MKKILVLSIAILVLACMIAPASADAPWGYKQRPAELVTKGADGVFTISNVRWGFDEKLDAQGRHIPKWRTVTVDTKGVLRAYLAIKIFPPEWLAAHGLMIFKFDPAHAVKTEYGETSKGLIVSVEAHLKEGEHFDLLQGMKNKWPNIWMLSSLEDYIQLSSLENLKVICYELDLTQDQVRDMLTRSLDRACLDHSNDMYNTLNASCVTAQVDVINEVVAPEHRIPRYFFGKIINLWASLPRTIGRTLRQKGLLRSELPILLPGTERAADHATKEFSGAARAAAIQRFEALKPLVGRAESILTHAVAEGRINADTLRSLMYHDVAGHVLYLTIPGVVPTETNNGEFMIGPEFATSVAEAGTPDRLALVVANAFNAYKQALSKRMLLEGPDISPLVARSMRTLSKSVEELVKTIELNER
jgi:hypothetical protein